MSVVANAQQMEFWLTDPDANILFEQQPFIPPNNDKKNTDILININETQQYQMIDGFGFALTGGSAMHLYNLDNATRGQILEELFRTDKKNIGTSYLRLSIGASDLDEAVFSYDDLPPGEIDLNMTHFDLGHDRLHVIPVLKEILTINPKIKLLGSPWSPPIWMKNNKNSVGGNLLSEYYDAYALYFVRYIQEMQKEGITIDAITIQNEPLFGGNNPSMVMEARDQANFIKQSLGPTFRKYSINTKIIVYDHNPNRPDYPITIYDDADARQYVDGSAFHLYEGTIDALSWVHDKYPDKHLYFTEQWVGAPGNLKTDLVWHTKHVIIGSTRNWARNAIEWNLAADSKWEPHTPGGCNLCLGAVTIDGNVVHYPRNPAYYVVAHAAKFARPGSTRIDSNLVLGLSNVAFLRSDDNRKVLIVVNEDTSGKQSFQIQCNGKFYDTSLNGSSVGTYIC